MKCLTVANWYHGCTESLYLSKKCWKLHTTCCNLPHFLTFINLNQFYTIRPSLYSHCRLSLINIEISNSLLYHQCGASITGIKGKTSKIHIIFGQNLSTELRKKRLRFTSFRFGIKLDFPQPVLNIVLRSSLLHINFLWLCLPLFIESSLLKMLKLIETKQKSFVVTYRTFLQGLNPFQNQEDGEFFHILQECP